MRLLGKLPETFRKTSGTMRFRTSSLQSNNKRVPDSDTNSKESFSRIRILKEPFSRTLITRLFRDFFRKPSGKLPESCVLGQPLFKATVIQRLIAFLNSVSPATPTQNFRHASPNVYVGGFQNPSYMYYVVHGMSAP